MYTCMSAFIHICVHTSTPSLLFSLPLAGHYFILIPSPLPSPSLLQSTFLIPSLFFPYTFILSSFILFFHPLLFFPLSLSSPPSFSFNFLSFSFLSPSTSPSSSPLFLQSPPCPSRTPGSGIKTPKR